MRIAVLSDVHGNLSALDAVLADIATRPVDLVVNLGDLLSGGLQPRETADRLMDADLATVRGNHERQLLTLPRTQMSRSDQLADATITDRHREWLAGLPRLRPAAGRRPLHQEVPAARRLTPRRCGAPELGRHCADEGDHLPLVPCRAARPAARHA